MSEERFAIVPRTTSPVDYVFAANTDEALVKFATSMDTDMNLYFKAVPEKLLKTGAEVKPNQWLEAVITTYSYDSPVVAFFTSQEDAIQYIKTSMEKELQYDRENGHDDSILENLEDELFGMKLTTFRNDGSEDTITMILAQSVYTGKAPTPAQLKSELGETKPFEESYLDILGKLSGSLVDDTTIPDDVRKKTDLLLAQLQTQLFPYSA